jgi:hypothetical protein
MRLSAACGGAAARMTRAIALLVCALWAAQAWAIQPPRRVELSFSVSAGSLEIGEGQDVLEHDGKTYSVTSGMKTVGVAAVLYKLDIRRQARGNVTPEGLQPLHFEEQRTRKAPRAVDFDHEARTITLTDGDKRQTLPLPDNTYDQTSFTYAFAFRPFPEELPTIYLSDGRKLSDYRYRNLGVEKLKTPLGEIEAVHIQKVREAGDKRGFEVWLAVEHHYLPVRVVYVEKNGQVIDSTITRIEYK